MSNENENIKGVKPLIFTKKINERYKIIPLNKTNNTVGITKHFPPATKEWYNSIYTYNKNSLKNLSIADKTFSKIIRSYFNLFFKKQVLKTKRVSTRFKRLAFNKIFVSKAELKHTSSKVIITLYIYNEEKRRLNNMINRIKNTLFPLPTSSFLPLKGKLDIINTHEEEVPLIKGLKRLQLLILKEIKLEEANLLIVNKPKLKSKIENTIILLNKELKNIISISNCINDGTYYKYSKDIYSEFIRIVNLEEEIGAIAYYKLLLNLNKSKFEDNFLLKLKPLIKKIYNKEVEFNIVNLKTMYLNSDIFTQAVSLKLKNKHTKLLVVLRYALFIVKLIKLNKMSEKFHSPDIGAF